jgi:predicted GIY-YIG superfamily endonuclease
MGKSGKPAPKPWFVYLLQCSNGHLYAGITTDVEKRLKVHNAGKGSTFVRSHRPATLVAFTCSESRSAASMLEYQVKGLTRAKKVALAKKWKSQRRTPTGISSAPK